MEPDKHSPALRGVQADKSHVDGHFLTAVTAMMMAAIANNTPRHCMVGFYLLARLLLNSWDFHQSSDAVTTTG